MKNKQVLIDSLPEGKLVENNYKLVESEMPKASSEEVKVKTISFAITAGTRAGPRPSTCSYGKRNSFNFDFLRTCFRHFRFNQFVIIFYELPFWKAID